MYHATARWRQSPRRATSVTRPATSRVTALRTKVEDQVAIVVVADRQTPSATSAAKSDTLRRLAQRLGLVAEEEEDTAEAEAEATSVARAGKPIP